MTTPDRIPCFMASILLFVGACAHESTPAARPVSAPHSAMVFPGTVIQDARHETQRLRSELASVKIASAKLAAELKALKEEAQHLRARENELGATVQRLREQVVALEAERDRLRRQNAELQAKTVALPSFQRMADQLEAQQALLQQLTGSVQSLTAALDEMKQNVLKTQQVVLNQSLESAAVAMAGADGHKPKGSVGHVRTLVVKPGDTLWRIARAHGVSIPDLQQLNGLTSSLIRVGQRLKVPMVSERTHEVSSAPAPAPTQSRPSSPNPKTSRGDASRTDTTTDPTASQSRDHQRTD